MAWKGKLKNESKFSLFGGTGFLLFVDRWCGPLPLFSFFICFPFLCNYTVCDIFKYCRIDALFKTTRNIKLLLIYFLKIQFTNKDEISWGKKLRLVIIQMQKKWLAFLSFYFWVSWKKKDREDELKIQNNTSIRLVGQKMCPIFISFMKKEKEQPTILFWNKFWGDKHIHDLKPDFGV